MKERLKNIKGITLIALVITIIVMIILVAVSVTVALNGELFQTAKTATGKTQLERDKELLMAAAVGALGEDGKVVYANIQQPEGFEKESDGTYTKDGYKFILDEYGTVTVEEPINFDAIKAAVIANPETYLARAAAAGQNTTSNTDIGIGTDGEIVNLDLWTYEAENNAITLNSTNTGNYNYNPSYLGTIINGKIQGTVPQYIYINNEMLTVTTIGDQAFINLNTITEITIPDSITSIGDSAFSGCSSLESIIIPDNIASIGASAFRGCSELKSIIIPDGVTAINDSTFKYCESLETIIIPYGVTYISNQVFEGCITLSSITIPNSVTGFGMFPFNNCTSLTEIKIDNTEDSISGSPWGASNATVTWLR